MPQYNTFYAQQPLVIAHRGARDVAPENTLAAFQAAIALGADGIELDVMRCASGEVVVIHDEIVDRTTDGSGRVNTLPLSALRELDAGSWFNPAFARERIPTLDEVLDLVAHRVRINIEIKAHHSLRTALGYGDDVVEQVAHAIRRRALEPWTIISSFSPFVLMRVRRLAPELQCGLLTAPDLPWYLSRVWTLPLVRPDALHPYVSMVSESSLAWARARGYRLNVWTVNSPSEMRRMIDLGVDGIITDHPAKLRALLSP